MLVAHEDGDAIAALEAVADGATLAVAFDPHGAVTLSPAVRGSGAVIARVSAIVVRAQADGTWARIEACRPRTAWPRLRPLGDRWRTSWDMAACGNRAKARRYRARQR